MTADRHSPTSEAIKQAAQDIEQCVWRACNARKGRARDECLEEMDTEVILALGGLDRPQRLVAMDTIIGHLENQGVPMDLLDEIFQFSDISKAELDAWRMENATVDAATCVSAAPRI